MNLIILTTGLSGSSVVTGLIKKAGYWTGEETVYKNNNSGKYETHENARLVELNEQLVQAANFQMGHDAWYQLEALQRFADLHGAVDLEPFKQFIATENQHSPWLWKDPKLWFTLGFWLDLIDKENTQFIVLSRSPYNLWSSQVEKRAIYDYGYLKSSEQASQQNLLNFIKQQKCQFLKLEYDSLLTNPANEIDRLNQFLGSNLNMDDWQTTYKKPSVIKMLKRNLLALPIYLKNYPERIR